MSNRIEALRIASSLSGLCADPAKIIEVAGLFVPFLDGTPLVVSGKSVETPKTDVKVETAKVETKPETQVEPKTEKKDEETLDTQVARLAKELLNKSRPKLIAALKELNVERARDLKPDQLANAAKVFEKAVKEA